MAHSTTLFGPIRVLGSKFKLVGEHMKIRWCLPPLGLTPILSATCSVKSDFVISKIK